MPEHGFQIRAAVSARGEMSPFRVDVGEEMLRCYDWTACGAELLTEDERTPGVLVRIAGLVGASADPAEGIERAIEVFVPATEFFALAEVGKSALVEMYLRS